MPSAPEATAPFDAEAHVAHMTGVLGLTIAPEWQVGVAANMRVTATQAALITAFPLDDHVEPAFAFEA
ncbi:Protein of unknown function [Pseudoxanthobacter soli DSM 19599]|uniref:DUF4089 domain-containing protein n=1 Tax=Pseudoxanthobacter soli DSM 19599 TaxID=1123029 RepID=A0A1M7ZLG1_9HYPH|nr:DUF4089 domain-containing protein [Pseudoxanthobacter soli]SHO65659.1 Protein of unknown function [Pseudoxanthobacter soli DSM 19599]